MDKEQREDLIRIAAAALLFAAALLIPSRGTARLFLFLIPCLAAGYAVVFKAAGNLRKGEVFDENLLMTLAAAGAFAIGEYPEAAAVMLFYRVGEFFQDFAVGRSRRSIASLMEIRPDSAVVIRNGAETTVSPEEVAVGETILIKPYARIPLDGVITEGETSVNSSALTGEPLPADKKPGDRVISGTMNLGGAVSVSVESPYGESTVKKILELVENASEKKARQENFITRFARVYTPCVVAGAALLACVPPLLFGGGWSEWIRRALIFLVVSCPCALVISVPLSFFGGIGGASRKGILIKGSGPLEALSRVGTVVFDKTGTLTKGSFAVTAIHPKEVSGDELLDIAAAAESLSNHPIAESIVAAHGKHIDRLRIGELTEIPGMGVKAVIDGKNVCVGNCALMGSSGVEWDECALTGSVVHVSVNGEYMGHILISDALKPDAKETVSRLLSRGVRRVVMLTGDMRRTAEAVAGELGIREFTPELLPAGKVEAVEALLAEKPEKEALAFTGDGVNDAPVLMRADVGIAMGALGSDAAIEAADIVIMDDKPSKIALAIDISRRTMRIVKENIALALGVKAVVLILGAAGIASMWSAVFADVGVLILATANAMRTLVVRES